MTCALQLLWPARSLVEVEGREQGCSRGLGPGSCKRGPRSLRPLPSPLPLGSLPVPAGQAVTLSCLWPSAPTPWSCLQCGISSRWSLSVLDNAVLVGFSRKPWSGITGSCLSPPLGTDQQAAVTCWGPEPGGVLADRPWGLSRRQINVLGRAVSRWLWATAWQLAKVGGEPTPSRWQSVAGGGA